MVVVAPVQDSGASSELHVEANCDGPVTALALKPLVKPHTIQSTTPMADAGDSTGDSATAGAADATAADAGVTEEANASGSPVAEDDANGSRTLGAVMLADAGEFLPSGRGLMVDNNSSSSNAGTSDGGGSNWARLGPSPPNSVNFPAGGGSVADSSDSEFSAASTTSTAWTADGFQTPARTDVPRGSAGVRYSGGGRRPSNSSLSAGLSDAPLSESGDSMIGGHVGMRTPGSHLGLVTGTASTPARLVPDTPSPRSTLSASGAGTPHVRI